MREVVDLRQSCGRVLAEPVIADREYPPFDRSTRDGFAVRSADAAAPGATLRLIGEIKAGSAFDRTVGAGECVQIMTGAAVPAGADAVVMIEHTRVEGDRVTLERAASAGQNIVPRGSEARAGEQLLEPGLRLGYAEMALAAQVGHEPIRVCAQPHVAILSTGDEVVDVRRDSGPLEVRNGNSIALEALVRLAGGVPRSAGQRARRKGRDSAAASSAACGRRRAGAFRRRLDGEVRSGRRRCSSELGAEFFFDAVAIRPASQRFSACARASRCLDCRGIRFRPW